MTSPLRIGVLIVVVSIIAVWLGRSVIDRLYVQPRDDLREEIGALRTRIDGYERELDGARAVRDGLAAVVDRTLGADVETVDHRLRTRLNRIAEGAGIVGATVGTGAAAPKASPARTAFPRGGAWKELRNEVDFVEVDAAVSGEGTLDQVVRLVDSIDAEPWMKRIDQLRLDPKANGDRFAFTVRLTTLLLPGVAPAEATASAYDASRMARFAPLLETNPFRLPPPPAPPVQATAPAPTPPPAGFPWQDWTVTGVASGPDGMEVWLRNGRSGGTKRLGIGDAIDRATLEAAAGEWAEFTLDGERFRVRVGRTLNDRATVNG